MNQDFADFQYEMGRVWRQYRSVVIVVPIVLVLVWVIGSTAYKVEADSEGVVLRLGKFSKRTAPGLHFKIPWPIDTVYTVPVMKVQSLEFGYRTVSAGRQTEYADETEHDRTLARMLTADLNLAHVEWVVQYQVKNPEDYLFRVGGDRDAGAATNARELIRDISEAVMRRIIGDVSIDSVITTGRQQIAADAKTEMQERLNAFESGIHVVAVKLQSATPPDAVKDAFDEVNRAKQSKEKVVNEAKGEKNRLIPAARGERDKMIAEAEGYALRVKKEAEGRANAFLARLAEYEKAPEVTKMRLYIEAMEEVLMQVDDKVIIDESVKGMLPLLHLGSGGGGQRQPAPSPFRAKKGGAQ